MYDRAWRRGLLASALILWGSACSAPPPSSGAPAAPPPSSAAAAPTARAAAAPPAAPAGAPVERQSVKVGGVVLLSGAPFYIASDRGYFAEEGIDFEFVPFDSGALA